MSTIRQQIRSLLEEAELNAREISMQLSIREKEVYDHLEHLKRTLSASGNMLVINPYQCLACGYKFRDRPGFKRPGRCPQCKSGHIRMASYTIKK